MRVLLVTSKALSSLLQVLRENRLNYKQVKKKKKKIHELVMHPMSIQS